MEFVVSMVMKKLPTALGPLVWKKNEAFLLSLINLFWLHSRSSPEISSGGNSTYDQEVRWQEII